jgi:hypothetical protein
VGERGASQSNIFLNNGNSYALPGYNQFDIEATAIVPPSARPGIDVPSLGRIVQLTLAQGS